MREASTLPERGSLGLLCHAEKLPLGERRTVGAAQSLANAPETSQSVRLMSVGSETVSWRPMRRFWFTLREPSRKFRA